MKFEWDLREVITVCMAAFEILNFFDLQWLETFFFRSLHAVDKSADFFIYFIVENERERIFEREVPANSTYVSRRSLTCCRLLSVFIHASLSCGVEANERVQCFVLGVSFARIILCFCYHGFLVREGGKLRGNLRWNLNLSFEVFLVVSIKILNGILVLNLWGFCIENGFF